jgi:hypothetical protein
MERLLEARSHLLALHEALVKAERSEYERENGQVDPRAFLNVLLYDEDYDWIRPMTRAVIELDELLEDGEPSELDAWVERARTILRADEQGTERERRYADALQRSPDVVLAHAAANRAIASVGRSSHWIEA